MFLSLIRLSVVFFLSAGVAQACFCDYEKIPNVSDSYSKATVVFSGTVIARGKYGIWFKVDHTWKGARSKTIYLYTGNAIGECYALYGNYGQTSDWLIYGYRDRVYRGKNAKRPYTYKLMSRACDRTKPLASPYAADDVRALDKLRSARMARAAR